MIGASKTQMVSEPIISDYSVSLTPGTVSVTATNGSEISATVYSSVINGVGPFLYSWVITGSDISILNPSDANTRFSASGFNIFYIETATLTVTDTGNANLETSRDISVSFEFEP